MLRFNLFEIHRDNDPYSEENWDEGKKPYEFNTTFVIGRRINRPNHYNTYKLEINNMHGDGDQDTIKTLYIEDEQRVKDIIEFCFWVNRQWVDRRKIENVGEEIFGDGLWDFLDRDVTADRQFPCRPSYQRLTWFDEEGSEWSVTVNCR
jgi:hypothetical protein